MPYNLQWFADGEGGEKTEPAPQKSYTGKEEVAAYIAKHGKLPDNFITKDEARDLGWEGGSVEVYAPGYAIGGLSVGEPAEKMYEMLDYTTPLMPKHKPRYLMGVGTPANLLEGIERGIDMFDCVMPTRNGRNACLFTSEGIMNMRNRKWADDFSPIDPQGTASVDHFYSKAYLHHLFKAQELLALEIASIHNLAFYLWLVGEARKHIIAGDFSEWKSIMIRRVTNRL